MNTAKQVDQMVEQWKAEGKTQAEIVWNTALACVGWSYVYSAWGAECTPAERRKRYKMCPDHETIKTRCKAFDNGNCSGCQWYPNNERTRCFDCRGFTDWCLNRVGFDLYGDTCGVQWNHKANWKDQGLIATMPKDTLCCLFVRKDGKFTHTGFGLNNATCECSSGVQYFSSRDKKWTHWAIPAIEGVIPTPTPTPTPEPVPTGYAIVTGKNVAVRQGPSTSCKVITRVPTGEKVKITAPPSDWEYVTYNGKQGYMMKQYLNEG